MEWDLEEALLPELLAIIFAGARALGAIPRARLRCVCKRLRAADEAYVSPLWTSAHPDLKWIRRHERRAWDLFRYFCRDAAVLGVLHLLGMPLKIQWTKAYSRRPWYRGSLNRVLRMEWPTGMDDGTTRRYMPILRLSDMLYTDGSSSVHYDEAEHNSDWRAMMMPEDDFIHGGSSLLVFCLPLPLETRRVFEDRYYNK